MMKIGATFYSDTVRRFESDMEGRTIIVNQILDSRIDIDRWFIYPETVGSLDMVSMSAPLASYREAMGVAV